MKKETIKEAAERIYTTELVMDVDISKDLQLAFINGVKWNQERSYSEEEVVNILMKVYEDIGKRKIPNPVVLAEWFNKFKKL